MSLNTEFLTCHIEVNAEKTQTIPDWSKIKVSLTPFAMLQILLLDH